MSQTCFICSHTTSEILSDHQGIRCQSLSFLTFLGLCTEFLGRHGAYPGPFTPCCQDNSGVEWISIPRALVAQYPKATTRRWRDIYLSWGKELLSTSSQWNYPG
jgi:hypothetical protein